MIIAELTVAVLLAFSALFAVANFYLSFIRPTVLHFRKLPCKHESGIPMLGNIALILASLVAGLAGLHSPFLIPLAVVLLFLDTGGMHWFCIMMIYMSIRDRRSKPQH